MRSRRARIRPDEAGLGPHAGRRRVPGLRREEVARLAGVSVDYYVRLECGRTPNASTAVLDAVARALRLDPAERAHLFDLAKPKPGSTGRRPEPPQRVRPGLLRVLDTLTNTPAMILGHLRVTHPPRRPRPSPLPLHRRTRQPLRPRPAPARRSVRPVRPGR
ncbi:helix-turn-helix domain-containing protein [Kitasatospora sp. NPDC101155]|uniref:helix-turn-helix domain-containing protein n=1 Tax=Kitasatospora sp. NPDC101155 TaxID=3364097 RepID=UPI0037FB8F29